MAVLGSADDDQHAGRPLLNQAADATQAPIDDPPQVRPPPQLPPVPEENLGVTVDEWVLTEDLELPEVET